LLFLIDQDGDYKADYRKEKTGKKDANPTLLHGNKPPDYKPHKGDRANVDQDLADIFSLLSV
jgi:hypothetical protein